MKDLLVEKLPDHILTIHDASDLYIVDYKHISGGEVRLFEQEPQDVNYVYLENENEVEVCFDAFGENALEIETGLYSRQCECLLFPTSCADKDWILFIETKYTNDITSAFKEENNYPNSMIAQILDTVEYFRTNEIIGEKRRVHAIVSFPTLIQAFDAAFFGREVIYNEKCYASMMDILLEYQVLIRATNSGKIISPKRLKI